MNRKRAATLLAILFIVLAVFNVFTLHWDDLSFSKNKSNYLILVSNGLLLIAMLITRNNIIKKENGNTGK